MAPRKTAAEGNAPVKQVNNILQSLRGEHFRHARNVQGKPASSGSFSSLAHNQPTLPIDLIYSSPAPVTNPSWVPGPSPPRSWQSPASTSPNEVRNDVDITAAWRARALSPFFSSFISLSSSESTRSRSIYPDLGPIPQLTLLCLLRILSTCPGPELAKVVLYIPPHLRRALLRYTAVHAPLSQIELDTLREGGTHVDTELIIVGPHNTLHASSFQKQDHSNHTDFSELDRIDSSPVESWDAVHTQDTESLGLRFLAILAAPLSVTTMLAFPPTITHLALIKILRRISLQRLPTICPLLMFLDLSYNTWLSSTRAVDGGTSILEEVEWNKLRRLEVIGLRECLVTPKVLVELNRGRWEDVRVIQ